MIAETTATKSAESKVTAIEIKPDETLMFPPPKNAKKSYCIHL